MACHAFPTPRNSSKGMAGHAPTQVLGCFLKPLLHQLQEKKTAAFAAVFHFSPCFCGVARG